MRHRMLIESRSGCMLLRQHGADKKRALSEALRLEVELEASLAAHGLLDGRLAVGVDFIVADVELCRQHTRSE